MDEERDEHEELGEEEENFADLLERSLVSHSELKPGAKVEAKVLKVGREWVFLDVGQKGEGVLDAKEILDEEGNPRIAEGEMISAYFLSRSEGELRFTTRIGGGPAGAAELEEAWRSGIPVEGRVDKEIKGGFEIRLPGAIRAFCPYSQIGRRRPESPEEVLGSSLPFKITRFDEQGRNIVVSHREIQEEDRRRQRESLKETLKEGDVVRGTITSVQPFGAFIDIGGVEGLIPVSEISYGRVEHPGDILTVGQELDVAVRSIDWEADRFSFSLRDTLADPWTKTGSTYREGMTLTGTVSRLATFGAFVTLEEGIDGLIHISRLGEGRRIRHPREVLTAGQNLTVTIEKIDRDARRISLVPASVGQEGETPSSYHENPSKDRGMGTLGDLLKAKMEQKKEK